MADINLSTSSTTLCSNGISDIKEIVNVLPAIHAAIVKAKTILKQVKFRVINPHTSHIATIPQEVAAVMREVAQAEESKKFNEFGKTINDASYILTTAIQKFKRTQYDVATHTIEGAQPLEQLHEEFDYMDQTVYLLYTINLELRKALLMAGAIYVYGLPCYEDQVLDTDELREALTRLLALANTSSHFLNNYSTVERPFSFLEHCRQTFSLIIAKNETT